MKELLPEGEELRRAVKWLSDSLKENPGQSVPLLVHETIFKFDLSPVDAEFLVRLYTLKEKG